MIVLDERIWAESAIEHGELGKKPYETFCRVAKYYLYKGFSKKETRRKLDEFLLTADPDASRVSWADTLDNAVKFAGKHPIIIIDNILITVPEMKRIEAVKGKQLRRLAFVLLCLAKYTNKVNTADTYWVNSPDKEIMKLANINTSIERQSYMYGSLREAGLIKFSKRIDSLSVQVCFAEDGDTALSIVDFRNLGYQYMAYCGDPCIVCKECGITVSIPRTKGMRPKYCSECAKKVRARQVKTWKTNNQTAPVQLIDRTYSVYVHSFPDGKKYVGMTSKALGERWNNGYGYGAQDLLCAEIDRVGWDNVEHYVALDNSDLVSAKSMESQLIRKFSSNTPDYGFNRTPGYNMAKHGSPKTTNIDSISMAVVDGTGKYTGESVVFQ